MSINDVLIILFIVSVLALGVAAPLIYLLRRLRRRREPRSPSIATRPMSWTQAVPGLVMVMLLLACYATEFVAPDSWMGLRVKTLEGKFWLVVLLWLVVFVVERVVRAVMPMLRR